MERQFVSLKEAGRALGVSESTARELTRTGELPAARIGRRVLVHAAGLREFADRKAGVERLSLGALGRYEAELARMEG